DSDPSLFVVRIAADFNLEGRLAGAWLAQASKGSCNIVELQGTVGSAPAIERKKGFEAIISQFPNMKIVRSRSGDFTTTGGKEVEEGLIKADGRPQGHLGRRGPNGHQDPGGDQAMEGGGPAPRQESVQGSVDGVPGILKGDPAGESNASVE